MFSDITVNSVLDGLMGLKKYRVLYK
jgi:hypothetical protein